jgi:glycosyltransferase involved in cell wall biosynthesis
MKQLFMSFLEEKKFAAVFVFPVRNEALILEKSIKTAYAVIEKVLPAPWLIIIAVNNSTDKTLPIAKRLSDELPNVEVRVLSEPGKGRAMRQSWESVSAHYYFFSDIDLSVDLAKALPQMLLALQGGADIVTGSRALAGSVVERPIYRRFISLGYRWLAKAIVGTRLADLPCGCKGLTARVVKELVPQVQNNDWFFDSELLLLGERLGFRIKEVPVYWVEYRYKDRRLSIPLLKTMRQYLTALFRVRRQFIKTN